MPHLIKRRPEVRRVQCIAQRLSGNRDQPAPEAPYQLIPHLGSMSQGIRIAHTAGARMAAQEWVQHHAGKGITHPVDAVEIGVRAAAIAWELMDNAHKYSRSGIPGGTLDLVLDRTAFLLTVTVTDTGPLTLFDPHCPLPRQLKSGGGLNRVAGLAFYWDWEGGAGHPVTVVARIELP